MQKGVNLLSELAVLILSLAFLVYSSRIVLDSSVNISRYFRLGEFAVGFILIAISTSLPELAVTLSAATMNEGSLLLGNIVGSNISDILLVLGFSALMGAVVIKGKELQSTAQILLMITIVPLILLASGEITFFGGLILILVFGIYVFFVSKSEITITEEKRAGQEKKITALVLFGIGMAVLLVSSHFTVESSIAIAKELGISTTIIGLTIIALGTSLPELMVNIQALKERHAELAFGNIMGSAVANLTLVMGAGALVTILKVDLIVESSLLFFLGTVAVLNFLLLRYNKISKRAGVAFIMAYIVFIMWQIGFISLFN